jgi:diamine N-acetyltransferase
MMVFETIAVGDVERLGRVEKLARAIWPVCYGGILSAGQIGYMLERMYAVQRLSAEQGAEGVEFVLMWEGEEAVGFAGWGPAGEKGVCKLHKLYVLPSWWGRGLGGALLEHVSARAAAAGYEAMRLNVNKFNERAIAVYRRKGFVTVGEVVVEIGSGYVMDDYVMEQKWSRNGDP